MSDDIKKTPVGPAKQEQLSWNPVSNARRVTEMGLDFFWSGGILGAIDTAQAVPSYSTVMIFNSSVLVQYIAFGDATVTVSGPTDGIPILAGQYVVLNSGNNTYVVGSAATVYAYLANE